VVFSTTNQLECLELSAEKLSDQAHIAEGFGIPAAYTKNVFSILHAVLQVAAAAPTSFVSGCSDCPVVTGEPRESAVSC
jgi:hypothetical protein